MEKNENVEMITGDPKKAINKLSLPIIASMFLIFVNNIIDSIWVAGLGTEPLAALGYITPLFLIMVGFGNGLGAGGNSSDIKPNRFNNHYSGLFDIFRACT